MTIAAETAVLIFHTQFQRSSYKSQSIIPIPKIQPAELTQRNHLNAWRHDIRRSAELQTTWDSGMVECVGIIVGKTVRVRWWWD